MANQLGHPGVSPRSYDQHVRHKRIGRVRHAQQFAKFLAVEATRLTSTSAIVFGKLTRHTAEAVRKAANLAALA